MADRVETGVTGLSQPSCEMLLIRHLADQEIAVPPGWGTFDNSRNPDYQLCEVGAFLAYFRTPDGEFRWPEGRTHVGLLSPKVFRKTRTSPEMIADFAGRYLQSHDALIINPFPQAKANPRNIWIRSEKKHPGILSLCHHTGFDVDKITRHFHGVRYTSYCNYFIGNRRFWQAYVAFISPIADRLMAAYRAGDIPDLYYHHSRPLSNIPYFLERCLSEFLIMNEGDLTFKKINRGKKFHITQFVVEPWSALSRLMSGPARLPSGRGLST